MMIDTNICLFGDALEQLKTLPDESVQMCVTSPPYWGLRDYGHDGQIGLEETPEEFIHKLVLVFREVKRVLKDDGTLWVNIGDSYAGSGKGAATHPDTNDKWKQSTNKGTLKKGISNFKSDCIKPKDLVGIPWMLAFALRADGWFLRQDIIWSKPNPMPESVTDRCTKSHEYIFLLSKSRKYLYDHEAIKEESVTNDSSLRNRDITKLNNTPGRSKMKGLVHNDYETKNKRSVWHQATKPYSGSHFAVYPPELITDCIKAGSKEGDIVLDPFFGSGTTGEVALRLYRKFIGIELNKENEPLIEERLKPHRNDLFGEAI